MLELLDCGFLSKMSFCQAGKAFLFFQTHLRKGMGKVVMKWGCVANQFFTNFALEFRC